MTGSMFACVDNVKKYKNKAEWQRLLGRVPPMADDITDPLNVFGEWEWDTKFFSTVLTNYRRRTHSYLAPITETF